MFALFNGTTAIIYSSVWYLTIEWSVSTLNMHWNRYITHSIDNNWMKILRPYILDKDTLSDMEMQSTCRLFLNEWLLKQKTNKLHIYFLSPFIEIDTQYR